MKAKFQLLALLLVSCLAANGFNVGDLGRGTNPADTTTLVPDGYRIADPDESPAMLEGLNKQIRIEEPKPKGEKMTEEKKVYKSVEVMPTFPGGDAALMKWLSAHIQYPANAAANNIEGKVVVQFVVTETGDIGEVKVVRKVDPELDQEAVRVVKSLPKFNPGRQDGKAVSVWYTLPVSFKLTGKPVVTPTQQ